MTWNITGTKPSVSAPNDWRKLDNKNTILDIIEDEEPDIMTLQEIPDEDFCIHLSPNYFIPDLVNTHELHTGIFIHKDHELDMIHLTKAAKRGQYSPVIGADLIVQDQLIRFFGCHLPPNQDQADDRLMWIKSLYDNFYEKNSRMIIAGDMNTRMDETQAILEETGVKDAWISIGQPEDQKYTWDSIKNKYHKNTEKFHARFDRVLYSNLTITDFSLIGNDTVSPHHYLSDHFGIVTEFKVD